MILKVKPDYEYRPQLMMSHVEMHIHFSKYAYTQKKCVAGTKKHITVPAILLTMLTINMACIN